MDKYLAYIPFFAVFILCGSAHEFCHAWSAFRLGDTTSRDLGRMTLNPLAHIDLMGTVLFPIITCTLMGLPFGWMKPVPVSLLNLRKPRRDMLLVSLAGPFSNLFLGFLGILVLFAFKWSDASIPRALQFWIWINLLLAFFNLLPIPPLDGSSVVDYFRKGRGASYHGQGFIGIFLLIILIYYGIEYLVLAVEKTYTFMAAHPVAPFLIFFSLFALGGLFLVKSSPGGAGPKKRKPVNLERMQIFQMARRIGLKLAAGEPLAHEESRWLDLLRMDQGDGEPLCAPVSFSPENDFCARCPNFKRCALRLVETLQQNRGLSS